MSTNEQNHTNIRGIKIYSASLLAIIISAALFLFIFIITGSVSDNYTDLVHHTQVYVTAQNHAEQVMAASDYLTE